MTVWDIISFLITVLMIGAFYVVWRSGNSDTKIMELMDRFDANMKALDRAAEPFTIHPQNRYEPNESRIFKMTVNGRNVLFIYIHPSVSTDDLQRFGVELDSMHTYYVIVRFPLHPDQLPEESVKELADEILKKMKPTE